MEPQYDNFSKIFGSLGSPKNLDKTIMLGIISHYFPESEISTEVYQNLTVKMFEDAENHFKQSKKSRGFLLSKPQTTKHEDGSYTYPIYGEAVSKFFLKKILCPYDPIFSYSPYEVTCNFTTSDYQNRELDLAQYKSDLDDISNSSERELYQNRLLILGTVAHTKKISYFKFDNFGRVIRPNIR